MFACVGIFARLVEVRRRSCNTCAEVPVSPHLVSQQSGKPKSERSCAACLHVLLYLLIAGSADGQPRICRGWICRAEASCGRAGMRRPRLTELPLESRAELQRQSLSQREPRSYGRFLNAKHSKLPGSCSLRLVRVQPSALPTVVPVGLSTYSIHLHMLCQQVRVIVRVHVFGSFCVAFFRTCDTSVGADFHSCVFHITREDRSLS